MIVSDFSALPSASWVGVNGNALPTGQPVVITYSFPSSFPIANAAAFPSAASSFGSFTEHEKQIARAALNQWAAISGITFIEVPEAFGDIRLQWIDGSQTQYAPTFGGLGFFPYDEFYQSSGVIYPQTYDYWITQGTHFDAGGEIYLNLLYRTRGDVGLTETILHEVGHAIGMKHPFDTYPINSNTLSAALDNNLHTVMTYTYVVPFTNVLGDLDVAAAQYLYGNANSDGMQYASWSYNPVTNIFTATAKAGGGYVFGTGTNDIIQGGSSSDYIATRTGNDTITGGLGNDTIGGGSGFDIAVFSGPRSSYTITTVAYYRHDVTGPDGYDILVDIDRLQFSDQFVDITPYAQVLTAEGGVLRTTLPEATATLAEATIGSGQMSLATYINQLIAQAEDSTVPALIVPQFIEGATPLSARLDGLTAFAAVQHAYYTAMGVNNPDLGPYEALGMGFSETSQFAQKFGMLSDTTFIATNYQDAFGRSASSAQINHFQAQIDYFDNLYIHAGIASDVAHVRARGAALGQMLGFAGAEANNDYAEAAKAFLLDASDGQVIYGSSLMSWHA